MKLLTIEQIQQSLDAEFLPLEPAVTGLRLIARPTSAEDLQQVQGRLKAQLPEVFRKMVAKFDFGDFAIGPVSFSGGGDYLAELLQLNEDVKWWGPGERPADRLMVANSDSYAFLLNLKDGRVMAFDREGNWNQALVVAEDFDRFLRGVGTVMLLRSQESDKDALAKEVARAVGAADDEFWKFLAC